MCLPCAPLSQPALLLARAGFSFESQYFCSSWPSSRCPCTQGNSGKKCHKTEAHYWSQVSEKLNRWPWSLPTPWWGRLAAEWTLRKKGADFIGCSIWYNFALGFCCLLSWKVQRLFKQTPNDNKTLLWAYVHSSGSYFILDFDRWSLSPFQVKPFYDSTILSYISFFVV